MAVQMTTTQLFSDWLNRHHKKISEEPATRRRAFRRLYQVLTDAQVSSEELVSFVKGNLDFLCDITIKSTLRKNKKLRFEVTKDIYLSLSNFTKLKPFEITRFEDIFDTWIAEYNGKVPFNSKARKIAFIRLISTLKLHAYSNGQIAAAIKDNTDKILDRCFDRSTSNNEQKKDYALRDLFYALSEVVLKV